MRSRPRVQTNHGFDRLQLTRPLTRHLVGGGGADDPVGMNGYEEAIQEGNPSALPDRGRPQRHRHRRPVEGRLGLERRLDPFRVARRSGEKLGGIESNEEKRLVSKDVIASERLSQTSCHRGII